MTQKKPDEFLQGYMCAVGTLIGMHGDSTEVSDLLKAFGKFDMKGIDLYDREKIKKTSWWKRRKETGQI